MKTRTLFQILSLISILPFIFWIFFDTKVSDTRNYHFQPGLHNEILRYFKKYDIAIEFYDTSDQQFLLSINLYDTLAIVIIDIDENDSMLMVRCPFPGIFTQSQMSELAIDFMQINLDVGQGSFEMDTIRKILIFRHSVDCRRLNFIDSTLYNEVAWTIQQMKIIIPLVLIKTGAVVADTTNNSMPEIS